MKYHQLCMWIVKHGTASTFSTVLDQTLNQKKIPLNQHYLDDTDRHLYMIIIHVIIGLSFERLHLMTGLNPMSTSFKWNLQISKKSADSFDSKLEIFGFQNLTRKSANFIRYLQILLESTDFNEIHSHFSNFNRGT